MVAELTAAIMIVMILSLKITDVVLSIFAFATTTSFSSSSSFTVHCNDNHTHTATHTVIFHYEYPFELENVCIKAPICSSSSDRDRTDVCPMSGAKASAEFFVFVGVLVMMYCLAALILYIFFDDLYRKDSRIIIADFVASTLLTTLWLISSCVWAAGVVGVKRTTDPVQGGFFHDSGLPDCRSPLNSCHVNYVGRYGSLHASVIFGFLNLLVWLGNLWCLYRETPWFKVQSKPPSFTPGRPSDLPLHLDIDLDPHKV